jgi:hypothetical protein
MKIAKAISFLYLAFIVLTMLSEGVWGMFRTIGWFGNIMITVAIIIVVQKDHKK